jgi:hypothetical protein
MKLIIDHLASASRVADSNSIDFQKKHQKNQGVSLDLGYRNRNSAPRALSSLSFLKHGLGSSSRITIINNIIGFRQRVSRCIRQMAKCFPTPQYLTAGRICIYSFLTLSFLSIRMAHGEPGVVDMKSPDIYSGSQQIDSNLFRGLSSISSNSNPSGTGWVGIQAITAFFVIIAAVAFALFLRPSAISRAQYMPV